MAMHNPPKHGSLHERFWRYVSVPGNPEDCWEWTGAHTPDGYGSIGLPKDKHGNHRSSGAHRVSYRLFVGPIPKGQCVCHTCDNRNCVNPRHLFLGTRAENLRDMYEKGRGKGQFVPCERASPDSEFGPGENHGEDNATSKYTAQQIRAVRSLVASGVPQAEAARRMGMSRSSVWQIVHRHQWAHIE